MLTFVELKNKCEDLYPAVLLEKTFPRKIRNVVRTILGWATLVSFVLVVLGASAKLYSANELPDLFYFNYVYEIRATFFLILIHWFLLWAFEGFYFSFYFAKNDVDFEVAQAVYSADERDITASFIGSWLGRYLLLRLGIDKNDIKQFLSERKYPLDAKNANWQGGEKFTLGDYISSLYSCDSEFAHWLASHSINQKLLIETSVWVAHIRAIINEQERWWTKDALSRVPSIGRAWAYGRTVLLDDFSHDITSDPAYRAVADKWKLFIKDVEKVEEVARRDGGANTLIVSESVGVGMRVMGAMGHMLAAGIVVPEIEHKRIIVLNTDELVGRLRAKAELEYAFSKMLIEANKAGNIILVIPNLATLEESAKVIGTDISELLGDLLESVKVSVIAIVDRAGYHKTIEPNMHLREIMEKVQIDDVNDERAMLMAEEEALSVESRFGVLFTYQAVLAVVGGAQQYFAEGILSDKIVDILRDLGPGARSRGIRIITDKDVAGYITKKTGVPQLIDSPEEKDKLLNLENVMRARVVGQDHALSKVAEALRRARAMTGNKSRPIGTFLFLGPTGVGKTETAKTLAQNFFGSEDYLIRLDMSEYGGLDAVNKLIGSYELSMPGTLSSMLREKQYGVLLLDEIEKSSKEVQNIFLRVLDEGYFTDGRGEKINCRNVIVIATSNVASDKIFALTKSGEKVDEDKILPYVVQMNLFKPELLNRFDATVIFNPLSGPQSKEIANIALNKLNKRLETQSIQIAIDDILLTYCAKAFEQSEFGARALNRLIQDKIESLIARGIIEGSIKSGDTVKFTTDSLGELIIPKI